MSQPIDFKRRTPPNALRYLASKVATLAVKHNDYELAAIAVALKTVADDIEPEDNDAGTREP